jgi:hypothetical protein
MKRTAMAETSFTALYDLSKGERVVPDSWQTHQSFTEANHTDSHSSRKTKTTRDAPTYVVQLKKVFGSFINPTILRTSTPLRSRDPRCTTNITGENGALSNSTFGLPLSPPFFPLPPNRPAPASATDMPRAVCTQG